MRFFNFTYGLVKKFQSIVFIKFRIYSVLQNKHKEHREKLTRSTQRYINNV